jgi:hypothetical protein
MRQPRARLAPVDAKPFEPLLQIARKCCCVSVRVVENEHPNSARLAIVDGSEPYLPRVGSGVAQGSDDGVKLLRGTRAEKRKRDVQVIAWDAPDRSELFRLPALDLVESLAGKAEREKKPKPFIATHARG